MKSDLTKTEKISGLTGIRYPWLHVIRCCLSLSGIFGFFGTLSFFLASEVVGGKVEGIDVPTAWEAGVYTHQKVYEWYTLSNHRTAFFAYIALLILSVTAMNHVQAEIDRAKAYGVPAGRPYWVAETIVQLVILGFAAYLMFFSLIYLP